jgi:hypothetical protein
MTAKLIAVEGSKIKIELTLELSRSMLDTEINIQKRDLLELRGKKYNRDIELEIMQWTGI